MELNTKYYIGDRVWLISGNKAVESIVTLYRITVDSDNKQKVTYELNHCGSDVDESKLFSSKEELLKSL